MREFFRKITGRPADSFDQVDRMETRKLPIPDLEGTGKFIRFVAERDKSGYWKLSVDHNVKTRTSGFGTVVDAFLLATEKHFGKKVSKPVDLALNFDTAYLILKDLEESILAYTGSLRDNEPDRHYLAAYRLLPKQFQESLDDLHHARTEKTRLLPDRTPQAAQKDDSAAKKPQPPKSPAAPN